MIRSDAQATRIPLAAFRPIALALPLFLLLAVFTAVTAHAAVICIPNDAIDGSCSAGQAQTTIQAGINAAVTGVDTVLVGAGSYNENLTLGKNIPLRGAQAGVDACGRVASEAIITAVSGTLLTLQTGSAGAEINGFHFMGGARGIESTSGPINLVKILNNRFTGFSGAAVFLNDTGTDIDVDQNEIIGTSKTSAGGSFHLDTDAFDGFHFTNNCVKDAPLGPGFFSDGNRNVGLSAGRSPLFDGNLFENHSTNVGVNIGSRSIEDGTFSNNVFRLNAFDGLQGGPLRTTFTNNTFESNGRNGLVMTSFGNQTAGRGSREVSISGNCFLNNGLTPPPPPAPTPPAGAGLRFSAQPEPQSTSVFNNNDFIGNLPGAIDTDTDPIDGTNNYWGAVSGPSGVGPGSGDIVSGPPTPGTGIIAFVPFSAVPQSFPGSLCNPFTPTPTPTPTDTPTNTPTSTPTPVPDADTDGVPDAIEDGAPNSGDGNDDGTPDSSQAHVSSLPNMVDGNYLTLVAPVGTSLTQVQALAAPPPPANPPSGAFPVGLVEFRLSPMPEPPTSIVVSLLLQNPIAITGYWRYGPEPGNTMDHWYQFDPLSGSPLTGATFSIPTTTQIDLTFVDGERGDDDLTANGVLVDQGGPINAAGPTGVDLRSFRAIGLADRAVLVWETAVEVDTLGFNIARAASPDGRWTLVNRALIPAEGSAASGQTYVLRDTPGRGTWHYRLEEVGADGKRTLHPATPVRVGPDSGGKEIFLPRAVTTRAGGTPDVGAAVATDLADLSLVGWLARYWQRVNPID